MANETNGDAWSGRPVLGRSYMWLPSVVFVYEKCVYVECAYIDCELIVLHYLFGHFYCSNSCCVIIVSAGVVGTIRSGGLFSV